MSGIAGGTQHKLFALGCVSLCFLFVMPFFLSCNSNSDGARPAWRWESESAVPVFTKVITTEEDNGIGSPDVISVTDSDGTRKFRMVFAQGGTDTKGRIGMAESGDGLSWARMGPGPSILIPSDVPAWDCWFLDTPCIVNHDDIWYLYYFGAASNDSPGGAIGLATSADGMVFTRASGAPVLSRGADGDWDGLWVESPSVIHDGTQFVMYYTGVDASWRPRTGRAVSPDGLTWTKDSRNPVLDRGSSGQWDSYAAGVPDAMYFQGIWMLFYCSQSERDVFLHLRVPKVGLALSRDGSAFSRSEYNPIIDGQTANYAPDGPYNPSVLFDDVRKRFLVWYETGIGFGCASAPALP